MNDQDIIDLFDKSGIVLRGCTYEPHKVIEFVNACVAVGAHPARAPFTRPQIAEVLDEAGYSEPQERVDFINGFLHAEEAHGITGAKP